MPYFIFRGDTVDIIVRFSPNSISFYVLSAYGKVRVGFEPFSSFSEAKKKLLRSIFDEQTAYDLESFLDVWVRVKTYRIGSWFSDNMINGFIKKMREELVGGVA